ncbi:MAG: RidA family protein [Bacteroidota bacterium]
MKAKRIVNTEDAPKAIGPFSQAVEVNGILYISGQLPLDPSSGKMVDGGISEQVGQVMKNIGAVLKAAGYDYSDVVKSTCMLSDMDNFKDFNTVYGKYFPVDPPARATFAVVKLPLGALVEIEAVAIKSK